MNEVVGRHDENAIDKHPNVPEMVLSTLTENASTVSFD